jgi:hypothetical protein
MFDDCSYFQFFSRQCILMISATATLASDAPESTSNWIEKMREMQEEKRKAAERVRYFHRFLSYEFNKDFFQAKQLQTMDDEFSVGELVEDETVKTKAKVSIFFLTYSYSIVVVFV